MCCRVPFSLWTNFTGLVVEHGIVNCLEELDLVLTCIHTVIIPGDAAESGDRAVLQLGRVPSLGTLMRSGDGRVVAHVLGVRSEQLVLDFRGHGGRGMKWLRVVHVLHDTGHNELDVGDTREVSPSGLVCRAGNVHPHGCAGS